MTNFYRCGPEHLSDHDKWEFKDHGFEWVVHWYDSTKLGHNQAGVAVGLYNGELYVKELDIDTQWIILDDLIEFKKIILMSVEDFWKEKDKFHQFNDWPHVKEMIEGLLREQQRIDHKKFIDAPSEAWSL
jgi:hypothetical protein